MSELATHAAGSPGPHAGFNQTRKQQSLLFPSVFGKLNTERKIHVLDIGPAQPETLNFFSPFSCRLHFAGMYDEDLVLKGRDEQSREELTSAFTDSLAIPEGTQFDLCLLWDFPNYLDDESLIAFSQALQPYLHKRTLGHGFAVRTSETRLDNRWYGLDQPHMFTLRRPTVTKPRFWPLAQAILINLLTCFSIDRGMLRPDGRLEVGLRSPV